MNWPSADEVHRTAKALIDAGKAKDPEEAHQILRDLVLQVEVGASVAGDVAAQAALLTIMNTGHRAFLGGVNVHLESDPILTVPWAKGLTTHEAITRFGGRVVTELGSNHPTLAIASPIAQIGRPILDVGARDWVAFVGEMPPSGEPGIVPAGVAAGALGVSEAFQHDLGSVTAGRRDLAVSLWRPDLPWTDSAAHGPALSYLPSKLWLLGLGHLGQAYAWVLGMLPFATPGDVCIGLMDFDRVIAGNTATQLLVRDQDLNRRKTRVVAEALERLSLQTLISERAFDRHFQIDLLRNEPTVALAGFDKPEPRLGLGKAGFKRVVDGGIGGGPVEYLDLLIHAFPSNEDPDDVFRPRSRGGRRLAKPYEEEIARRVATGENEAAVRCGMLDLAGVTVGAAFVGAFTGSMVLSDILRHLNGGLEFSVIGVDLRNPCDVRAVQNRAPGPFPGIDFTTPA